jgi:D-3-phosphoglycerate dehydrogenase / 2-oxoglutarate reductase
MSRRILITPRSLTQAPGPDLAPLENAGYQLVYAPAGKTPSEGELLELVPDCVGWLAGVEAISERVLRSAAALKAISRNGTGVDNVPVDLAQRLGIKVLRAEGANARGVAELAICLALASLRHLPALHPYPTDSFQPGEKFRWGQLDAVLASAEILSLHCPPLPDGRPLIDHDALSRIKPGCCLINTARGSLVDEDAIMEALDSGKLSIYATDVFPTEPPDPASLLLRHERVIVSPHIGAFTEESVQRATRKAVENLLAALA